MKVPFIDLKAQYEPIKGEIASAIQRVLDNTAFAGGPFVQQFEKEFASFCHCRYAIGVGSGTEALWLSLLALGIGPGDGVITVPNTFIATAEAISFSGASPIFVDIDESTYTMDPQKLEDYLKKRFTNNGSRMTPRPKAVIPVHLYGQMADMDPIMEIAREYNLFVIEDACQAHGAGYKGRQAGSIGDTGCFSFYPAKNLGAYGEAGTVITNSDELNRRIRMLLDHGQPKKYYHTKIGWNARMDGIQGAVLSVKLKYLTKWNESRRKNAQLYDELLADVDGIVLSREAEYAKHVYHIYGICVQNRDAVMKSLAEKDIQSRIHYPLPLHLQEAYAFLGLSKGSFPVAENCSEEFVSLPMYPELTKRQIEYVAHNIKRLFTRPAIAENLKEQITG
jgi:dTDP-4-amino-4,6-dideoxygalactose transaminase